MNTNISPIIEASELLKLHRNDHLVLIDASSGKNAKQSYESRHLDGALYVDLNTQLATIDKDLSKGGRHPLPSIEQFSNSLTSLGITNESHVVIYDDKNGANAAARFWWMLKSIGHKKVQVLNGGLAEAEKFGFPVNSNAVTPKITKLYKAAEWMLPVKNIIEVEEISRAEDQILIDVREEARYNGEAEPIDLIAGHIPGAINVPYSNNLNEQGLFLPAAELKEKYQKIIGDTHADKITVHCGSGVTACHTLLALAHAGFEIPNLYVGSWSEWSRNNKPIATNRSAKS